MAKSLRVRNKMASNMKKKPTVVKEAENTEEQPVLSPGILMLLLFVVVGSAFFGLIVNARNAARMGIQAQIE